MKSVVIGRLLLLLVAAAAVASALVLSRRHDRAVSSLGGRYACPMHPEATSRTPGDCPICRMALEPAGWARPGPSSATSAAPVPGSAAADIASETGPASSAFPEPASLPNYRLVAAATRRTVAREVLAPAWLEPGGIVVAVLYEDELAGLVPGEHGLFFRAAAPTAGVDVRLTAEPQAERHAATWRVRFRVDPRAPGLRPGDVGWVKLAARPRELLVVPSTAIVNSPQGAYVLVASMDGLAFTKRYLETSRAFSGFAVVLSGLRDQERVVVGNTFFLDAERRLRPERQEAVAPVR
jgi:hypothetical protein